MGNSQTTYETAGHGHQNGSVRRGESLDFPVESIMSKQEMEEKFAEIVVSASLI